MASLTGTASASASVAAVLSVAKIMLVCWGVMFRCEMFMFVSVRVESVRLRFMVMVVSVVLFSASGDAATRRYSAGSSVSAYCVVCFIVFICMFLLWMRLFVMILMLNLRMFWRMYGVNVKVGRSVKSTFCVSLKYVGS